MDRTMGDRAIDDEDMGDFLPQPDSSSGFIACPELGAYLAEAELFRLPDLPSHELATPELPALLDSDKDQTMSDRSIDDMNVGVFFPQFDSSSGLIECPEMMELFPLPELPNGLILHNEVTIPDFPALHVLDSESNTSSASSSTYLVDLEDLLPPHRILDWPSTQNVPSIAELSMEEFAN
jgi:hypothetical protein